MKNRFDFHNIFWIILVCLLPILALFVLASIGIYISGWLFIGLLLLCFILLHYLFRGRAAKSSEDQEGESDELKEIEVKQPLLDCFQFYELFIVKV